MKVYYILHNKIFDHCTAYYFTSEIELTKNDLPGLVQLLDIPFKPDDVDGLSLIDLSDCRRITKSLEVKVFDVDPERLLENDESTERLVYVEEIPYETLFPPVHDDCMESFRREGMEAITSKLLRFMLQKEPELKEKYEKLELDFDSCGYWSLFADGNCIRSAKLPEAFYKNRRAQRD